jgi:hypothetical protein
VVANKYPFNPFRSQLIAIAHVLIKNFDKIGKLVVKAVPNPVKQMSKTILRHTLIKK